MQIDGTLTSQSCFSMAQIGIVQQLKSKKKLPFVNHSRHNKVLQDSKIQKLSFLNLHESSNDVIQIVNKATFNLINKYQKESLGAVFGTKVFLERQGNIQQKFREDLYLVMQQIGIYVQSLQEIIQIGTIQETKQSDFTIQSRKELRKVQHQMNDSLFKIIKFLDGCLREHFTDKIKFSREIEDLMIKNFLTCERCGQLREQQKIQIEYNQMVNGYRASRLDNDNQSIAVKQKPQAIYSNDTCLDLDQIQQKLIKIQNGMSQRYYTMTRCIQDLEAIQQGIVFTEGIKNTVNLQRKQDQRKNKIINPFNPAKYSFQLGKHYNELILKVAEKLNKLIEKFQLVNKKTDKSSTYTQTATNYISQLNKELEKQKFNISRKFTSDLESQRIQLQNLKTQLDDSQNLSNLLIVQKNQIQNERNRLSIQKKQISNQLQLLRKRVRMFQQCSQVSKTELAKNIQFDENYQYAQEQEKQKIKIRKPNKNKTHILERKVKRNKTKGIILDKSNDKIIQQNQQTENKTNEEDQIMINRIKKAKLRRDYFSAFSGLKRHENIVIVNKNDIEIQFDFQLEILQDKDKSKQKIQQNSKTRIQSEKSARLTLKSFNSIVTNKIIGSQASAGGGRQAKSVQISQPPKNKKYSQVVQKSLRQSNVNTRKLTRKTMDQLQEPIYNKLKTIQQSTNEIENRKKTQKKFYKDTTDPYQKLFILNRDIFPQEMTKNEFKLKLQKYINDLSNEMSENIKQINDSVGHLQTAKQSVRNSVRLNDQYQKGGLIHSRSAKGLFGRISRTYMRTTNNSPLKTSKSNKADIQRQSGNSSTNHTEFPIMNRTTISKICILQKQQKIKNYLLENSHQNSQTIWKPINISDFKKEILEMRNSADNNVTVDNIDFSNQNYFTKEDIKQLFFSEETAFSFEQEKNLPKLKKQGIVNHNSSNFFKKGELQYCNQLLGVIAALHANHPKMYDIVKNFIVSPYEYIVNQKPCLQTMKSQQFSSMTLKQSINGLIILHRRCGKSNQNKAKENTPNSSQNRQGYLPMCPHLKHLLTKIIRMNIL